MINTKGELEQMAKAKSFKNTAANFISAAETEEIKEESIETLEKLRGNSGEGINVPKGYKIVPETKSARMQLLIKPSTKEELRIAAAKQCTSVNELTNKIIEEYLERWANG